MQATQCSIRTLRFGFFEVDLRAAELRKHGVRIKIQEQPFHILALLLDRPGDIVSREELRQELWPAHTFVDFDRSLNKAMTKLRAALGDSPETPRYIETLHRRGYRFLAPITVTREEASTGHAYLAHLPEEGTPPPPEREQPIDHAESGFFQSHSHPPATWTRFSLLLGTSTVAVCLVALILLRVNHSVAFGGSLASLNPRRAVAVLGFKNLSGDAQEAWLSTALSDWLTTELSAGDQLRTIPAESIARMRMELSLPNVDSLGKESLARIHKNLGTDLVVVGSYAIVGEKSDGQIRLDLHLQDTITGETVISLSETGTQVHLFALVSKAGEQLRTQLGLRAVTSEEAAEVAIALPSGSEAARLYSEGMAKLRIFDALAARDLLANAVASEPNYALSHAALATAWAQLGYDEKARAEAKKAFDLSVNLSRAERLLVEGRYREASRDWDKAIGIYRALFEFFPDNLDYGLALVSAQVSANRWKEALMTVAALRALPAPLRDDPRIDLAEGDAARSLGDVKRAEACFNRAAERARATGASLLLAEARLAEAWALVNLGRSEEIDVVVREAKEFYLAAHVRRGAARAATMEAIALANQGDYLGAKKGYQESLAISKELGSKLSVANGYINIGDVFYSLGDLVGARKSFEEALATYIEIGDQDGVALAQNDLGEVSLALGNHIEAKSKFEEALDICHQIGDRSRGALVLSNVGRALWIEGDVEAAQRKETEAREIFEVMGAKSEVARVNLELAELFLDQGRNVESVDAARQAMNEFERQKAYPGVSMAGAIMARALLAQGKLDEAAREIARATTALGKGQQKETKLFVTIASARVQTASGRPAGKLESEANVQWALAEATRAGFMGEELEARLVLGEIEMHSGNLARGRTQLEQLERDAVKRGFGSVARKVAAVLRTGQEYVAMQIKN
jgi:DNA-binding winged helix-turn-helix (wHTH) protein/tetratricopeptide (TPR) repeat protein